MPYPYAAKDAGDYISAMLAADENETFLFAVTADDKANGSIGVFRKDNIHYRIGELDIILRNIVGAEELRLKPLNKFAR